MENLMKTITKSLVAILLLSGLSISTLANTNSAKSIACTVTYINNLEEVVTELAVYEAEIDTKETSLLIEGTGSMIKTVKGLDKNSKFYGLKLTVFGILSANENIFPSEMSMSYELDGMSSSSKNSEVLSMDSSDERIETSCVFL
jgi:hypothetical protein